MRGHPDGTLVVIALGRAARTLRIKADSLNETAGWSPNIWSMGPSGSSLPDMTLQKIDEATFSKQLAEKFYRLAHKDASDHILIADRGTPGEVRPLL